MVEDDKEITRNWKDKQYNIQKKRTKEQTIIYKNYTEHRILSNINHTERPVRMNISCSTSGTCRVTPIKNAVISHERGKEEIVTTTTMKGCEFYIINIHIM